MINNVILIGRLTKDIVVKKTTTGKSVCNFTLAVDRRVKKEGSPTADFISCIVWEKGADILSRYAHKGSQIGVEGSIQTRNYEDPNTHNKVYVTEVLANSITLLGSKQNGSAPTEEVQEDDYSIDFSDMPF